MELSSAQGVYVEPEHPKLTSQVVCGRRGVERESPALVLMWLEDRKSLPSAMALVLVLVLFVVLGFEWNPASILP